MKPADSMSTLAASIGKEVLAAATVEAEEIAGLGSVNRVFRVWGPLDSVVVRLNAEPHRVDEFRVEERAMRLARGHGIPTAEILAIGHRDDVERSRRSRSSV
jgi:hypothetical protein